MNILLFSRICAKTGVGNHMRQLAQELVRQGHAVWVLSSDNTQGIPEGERLHVLIKPFTARDPVQIVKNLLFIRKIIQEYNIDVVHCHHRMAALYMKIYRFFWKTPVVYTLHLAPIPNDWFHKALTYTGDIAIGVSTEVAAFLKKGLSVPENRVTVVLNGVEVCGGGDTVLTR